jgi:uncharacterized membrane protein YozB (DUF420 family)
MSKLQKAAWFNLAMITICISISLPCLYLLARVNAKGIDYLLVCFVVACLVSPVAYILVKKKGFEARFDEREKMINRNAFTISVLGLIIFLGCVCTIPFFVLGGQSFIKVYYLPLIFFCSIFAAQFVHSAAIIVQCALEEEDGQ